MKAAFFDRDGTLITDVHYLSSPEQIELIQPMIHVGKVLQEAGYKLIVVTNQSGVARGMFSEKRVHEVHNVLVKLLAEKGVSIAKCFYCPHHPTAGDNPRYTRICDCRKPAPGMLLQAAEEFGINLKSSFMIGDKECDLKAGIAAGCKSFLVQDIVKDVAGWLQQKLST